MSVSNREHIPVYTVVVDGLGGLVCVVVTVAVWVPVIVPRLVS